MFDAVLASDDDACTQAIAAHPAVPGRVLPELAHRGRPDLAVTLYTTVRTCEHPGLHTAILAAADPRDAAWRAPRAFVDTVLTGRVTGEPEALPRAPFAEIVQHTLRRTGPDLPPRLLLDACRRLRDLGGPAALDALEQAGGLAALGHPGPPGATPTLAEAVASAAPARAEDVAVRRIRSRRCAASTSDGSRGKPCSREPRPPPPCSRHPKASAHAHGPRSGH